MLCHKVLPAIGLLPNAAGQSVTLLPGGLNQAEFAARFQRGDQALDVSVQNAVQTVHPPLSLASLLPCASAPGRVRHFATCQGLAQVLGKALPGAQDVACSDTGAEPQGESAPLPCNKRPGMGHLPVRAAGASACRPLGPSR
jgi:hypothetical protein